MKSCILYRPHSQKSTLHPLNTSQDTLDTQPLNLMQGALGEALPQQGVMGNAVPHQCDVQYSPFLKCGETGCFPYNGKHVCIFHLYQYKCNEECSICLDSMSNDDRNIFILSCGHMFHKDCLSKMKMPCCPLCRKQFTPTEANTVFHQTVIEPLTSRLYELPVGSIKYCLQAFDMVLYLAKHCQDGAWLVWFKLCGLAGRMGL